MSSFDTSEDRSKGGEKTYQTLPLGKDEDGLQESACTQVNWTESEENKAKRK